MSVYERLREEQNEQKARRVDRTARGQKTRWIQYAKAKRFNSAIQRYKDEYLR